MATEFILYTDESEQKGQLFSNFFGGALLNVKHLSEVECALQDKKDSLGIFNGEVKWQKVSTAYLQKYIEFIDVFFDHVQQGHLKVRVMFTQNVNVPKGLTKYHRDREYHLLYYQFIKQAFGIHLDNHSVKPVIIKVLIDQLPKEKRLNREFKAYLARMNSREDFKRNDIAISQDDISEVESKSHVILQGVDVITGSIQFVLNKKHKEIPQGKRRRGKKTVAKHKLYKHILARIRGLGTKYTHFNIGISTGSPADRWTHPYRHWLFVPLSSDRASEKWKSPI